MNRNRITLLISGVALLVAIVMAAMTTTMGVAKVDKAKSLKFKLKRPDLVDLKFVAVNNWYYAIRNQGSYMYDSPDADGNGNNAGGEFPRGSGVTIVFAGGLYIGTLKGTTPVVSETEFATEFQPGHITNTDLVPFSQLTADNPLSADNVVYYNDRGLAGAWPTEAPRDQFGQPAIIADGQTWAVFNDLDVTLNQESNTESPSPGLGMEVAQESFVFNAGPLSDVVYFKFTITNKTDADYENSYLGLWMDPDVDNASNDLVGIDTARGLGFAYNDDNTDAFSATGFDFFQGPVVDTLDVSQSLRSKFKNNNSILVYDPATNVYKPTALPGDQIWLGATAFNTYANGTDPVDNNERYNLLAGRVKETGIQKFGCGINDYYAFRGDPITGQGTCDVAGAANPDPLAQHADQRMLHCVGPFTIKSGASQEIWAGVIGANSLTGNRLTPISIMRATDDLAQSTFNAGLIAPAPPAAPKITVVPVDGAVSITWQNNSELTPDNAGSILQIDVAHGFTEDYVAYDFQGYRVYKSLTGLPGSYTLLAQYDKADGVKTIINRFLNTFGHVEVKEIVVGTDTGLRYAYVDHDVINGQRYYYSVTAYDAQPYIADTKIQLDVDLDGDGTDETINAPSGLPISLESAPTSNVVSAVPMKATLGNSFSATADANAAHSSGTSDGRVDIEVVNPNLIKGHNYRLEFFNLSAADGYPGNDFAYVVLDVTSGDTASFSNRIDDPSTARDERKFNTILSSGDPSQDEFGVVDGMLVKVYGPPLEVKGFGYTGGSGTGARWMTGINFGFEQFFGGLTLGINFFGSTVSDDAYRDIDLVFSNVSSGWSISYGHGPGGTGAQNKTFTVPFKAMEVDPTDGDATPHQVNTAIRDANNLNGWFLDNTLGGDGTGPQTRSYVHVTNSAYDAGAGALTGITTGNLPILYSMDMAPRNQAALDWNAIVKAKAAGGLTALERDSCYELIPDDGTFHIFANHINTTLDKFSWNTTANAVTTAKKDLKKGLDDIKVVPNPYYGRSEIYQSSLFDKRIKFTNLPASCTIKIFTVSGDLVSTINHNSTSNNDRVNTNPLNLTGTAAAGNTSIEHWNLQNVDGKFVASGMYVALIQAPGVGKKLVKFAVIQEEVTINGPDIR